jgi:PAS domain S-box-containing protein
VKARFQSRFSFSLQSFPKVASVTAMLVGGLVLAGWALDITTLTNVLPSLAAMNANTALAFILAGISLGLRRVECEPSVMANRDRRVAQFCAFAVMLVGLLTLAEHVFGWDLGIDQLLFRESLGAIGASSPGRMAPNAAFNFVLVGIALLLLDAKTRRVYRPAQLLTLTVGFASMVALTGYAYGSSSFYGVSPYTKAAVHTAAIFVVLCVGIFSARPDSWLMTILASDSAGGFMARRFLPAALFLPLVLGLLRQVGQRVGLYDTEYGLALFAVSNIVLLAVLILWSANLLFRVDTERRQAEESRRAIEEKFRAVTETANDAIVSADSQGNISYFNRAAGRMFDHAAADMLGKPLTVLMPERFHDPHRQGLARFLLTGEPHVIGKTLELAGKRKDGSEFPIEISLANWKAGEQTFFTAVIRDISDRKRAEKALEQQAVELARSNAELAATNKELEAFTYSASHDLRAPLRHMDGYSKILMEEFGAQLDSDAQHCLQRIQKGAQQMGRLVDDLLNLGRMGRQAVSPQPTALKSLVLEVLTGLKPETPDREIEWRIGDLPVVECDPGLMKLVFANLLSNAIKFTRPQKHTIIEVGQMTAEGQPVIFVRDNGIGFNMRYVDKLFGIFQRLHRQEEFEGTGVGLANVQRIIQKHGGRVWAEAEPYKGATFYFTVAGPAAQEPEIATERGEAWQTMR